eukprot:GHVS01029208.1.p1 GENE.GHVS01029208.1~~GHVS01029208.1.p1  ORF type:complete len:396 (-),score=22.77 GHVS01029208.1:17-1204(-)
MQVLQTLLLVGAFFIHSSTSLVRGELKWVSPSVEGGKIPTHDFGITVIITKAPLDVDRRKKSFKRENSRPCSEYSRKAVDPSRLRPGDTTADEKGFSPGDRGFSWSVFIPEKFNQEEHSWRNVWNEQQEEKPLTMEQDHQHLLTENIGIDELPLVQSMSLWEETVNNSVGYLLDFVLLEPGLNFPWDHFLKFWFRMKDKCEKTEHCDTSYFKNKRIRLEIRLNLRENLLLLNDLNQHEELKKKYSKKKKWQVRGVFSGIRTRRHYRGQTSHSLLFYAHQVLSQCLVVILDFASKEAVNEGAVYFTYGSKENHEVVTLALNKLQDEQSSSIWALDRTDAAGLLDRGCEGTLKLNINREEGLTKFSFVHISQESDGTAIPVVSLDSGHLVTLAMPKL